MSERLQWMLELQDRVSGPAERIDRQLGRVRASLKVLDIEARQNALGKLTDPLKRQRAELQLQRDKLMLSKTALEKVGGSSRRAGSDTGYFTRQLHDMLHIAQIVGSALERVGRVSLMMGRSVASAVSFKQREMVGLSTFLGGKAGGAFERMTAFAGTAGIAPEGLIETYKTLAMAGFPGAGLDKTVKRIADLNALHSGTGDQVAGVLSNVFGSGIAGGGAFEALRGTGLHVDRMYEDLAEKLGYKRNRFLGKRLAEMNPMGIGVNRFTKILQGEIDRFNGGVPGSKAVAAAQNPEGKTENFFTQMKRMASHLDKSSGIKALNKILDNLADIFNPDSKSGKAMLARLNLLSDVMAKFLEPLTGPDGKKRMEAFFDSLAEKVSSAIGGVGKLAGLIEKIGQGWDLLVNAGAVKGKTIEQLTSGDEGAVTGGPLSGLTAEARERVARSNTRGQLPPINISIQVDARGAAKDDADDIADRAARKAEEAITRSFERINIQAGGSAQ